MPPDPALRPQAGPGVGRRRWPWPRRNTPEQVRERQELLRALPHWDPANDFVFEWPRPPEQLAGMVEALTAHVVLPVSVAGPLRVDLGRYRLDDAGATVEEGREHDEVYVPLAHTEGGLSASVQRGAAAVLEGSPIRTHVVRDRMTRDSCFLFRTTEDALTFARWVAAQAPEMRRWLHDPANPLYGELVGGVARLSRHARLWEVDTHVLGPACHVLYRYTTGEACGPNMITRNSFALNTELVQPRFTAATGISPERVLLESNMGGDKKPSAQYFIAGGHGKTVLAEVTVREATLRRVLRTTARDMAALEHLGLHGSHASGMQSVAFTPASAIAAVFAATGQDLGMVGTSSMAHGTARRVAGGLQATIRFGGLEVGTVGGGTTLPSARDWLASIGCAGGGKVYRLAQIVAAAALCLEISASSAMATAGSENFFKAHHERGGLR